jgi:hypothetical protein
MKDKFIRNLILGNATLMIVGSLIIFIFFGGCTQNTRARSWGGKMTIDLPVNQKLINVTWKETDLWVLTKPMSNTDVPETYKFIEKSTLGIMEGEITIKETR